MKKNRLLIILSLNLLFISCSGGLPHYSNLLSDNDGDGRVDNIVEVVEGLKKPVFSKRKGCNLLYPDGVENVLALIQCKNETQLVLFDNGILAEDDSAYSVAPQLSCAKENILVNGSFEEGHGLGNNQWDVYSELPGWFANLEFVDAPIEVQNGQQIGGQKPFDGDAKIELDSHAKGEFTGSDSVVTQKVETKAGEVYKLSFAYSPRVEDNVKTNIVEVFWNGKKVVHLNNTEIEWEVFELSVLATGQEGVLEFKANQDKNTLGGYIDDVKLMPVCD